MAFTKLFKEQLIDVKSDHFCLQEFETTTPEGKPLYLIIAMPEKDIPAEGETVDFTAHEPHIILKKEEPFTQKDRDSAREFFTRHYCNSGLPGP